MAKHAKIACIEPSDSQECKDFAKAAFEISERFDMPVLLRTTTRVSHSKSLVEFGEREEHMPDAYKKDAGLQEKLAASSLALDDIADSALRACLAAKAELTGFQQKIGD